MNRIVPLALSLIAPLLALAQEAKPEAPMEKADPLVVLLFLVIFVGSGVVYGGYLWWRAKKDKEEGVASDRPEQA